jgi:hypothetical protein
MTSWVWIIPTCFSYLNIAVIPTTFARPHQKTTICNTCSKSAREMVLKRLPEHLKLPTRTRHPASGQSDACPINTIGAHGAGLWHPSKPQRSVPPCCSLGTASQTSPSSRHLDKSPRQAKKAPQESPQIPGVGHRYAKMQSGIPKKH